MYSLVAALFAATALAAPATTPDSNACTTKSTHVQQLDVSNFSYNGSWVFSTPAHQIDGGYVSFTVKNDAINWVAHCSATSFQLEDFFFGTENYNCTDAAGKVLPGNTFSYSAPANTLSINQTWSCPEGSTFWAEATAKMPTEDCKESSWQNPDWSMGQIYSSRSVNCAQASLAVPLTSLRAAA